MANEERGEVDLVVGDKTYTLRMSVNAIVETQKRTNKTFGELVRSLQALDVSAMRELVWMLLKKHHAKDFPTPEKVGDLIDDAGSNEIALAIEKVFQLNAWKAEGAAGNGQRPQPAQDPETLTGTPSTSVPVGSV